RMKADPRLRRLVASIAFIEQPIKRQNALTADVSALSKEKPVIIDESDDTLDAFPRARALGYRGVSSKTCKGIYKSIINAARSHGEVRVRNSKGELAIGSLDCAGYASGAMPDWQRLREMKTR